MKMCRGLTALHLNCTNFKFILCVLGEELSPVKKNQAF